MSIDARLVAVSVLWAVVGCGSSPPPPPPLPPTVAEQQAATGQPAPELRVLRFPDDVEHRLIDPGEAQQRFVAPEQLVVQTDPRVRVDGGRLLIDTWVTNPQVADFVLIVFPVGGSFPYGGDSPLSLRFSRATLERVKYAGPTFPPEPPQPMEIVLPAQSRVWFSAQLDLANYEYAGQLQAELEWSFHFWQGESPSGTLTATLPEP